MGEEASGKTRRKRVTAADLRARKGGEPIVCLTAYDYPTARLLDRAGVDLLLVGDSIGTTIAGQKNTLQVTMEQTITHTRYVADAAERERDHLADRLRQ